MKPKVIRPKLTTFDPTPEQKSLIKFEPAAWTGKNTSGFFPLGDKVLVMPDKLKSASEGGVALPPEMIDRMTLAAETGTIVAVGEGAFTWNSDRITKFLGRRPQAGDRVFMERYAGQTLMGTDGQFYRLMDDRSIGAINKEKDDE